MPRSRSQRTRTPCVPSAARRTPRSCRRRGPSPRARSGARLQRLHRRGTGRRAVGDPAGAGRAPACAGADAGRSGAPCDACWTWARTPTCGRRSSFSRFHGRRLRQRDAGRRRPRVGLLSNGSEALSAAASWCSRPTHGLRHSAPAATRSSSSATSRAAASPGGCGRRGDDGFTGNVALKLVEGVSQATLGAIRDVALASVRGTRRRDAASDRAARVSRGDRPERQGGAYLLGLRQLGVLAHGSFTRHGIARAIVRARGVRRRIWSVARTARSRPPGRCAATTCCP